MLLRPKLLFVVGLFGLLSCASINGTPMRGSADCRYVPSVEDCQIIADRIEDLCLRTCVVHLCRGDGRAVCDEAVQVECVRRTNQHPEGDQVGGFVPEGPQTCEVPAEEVHWCQVPHSPPCQAQIMVHELAHACGWHHGQGQGVPANNGKFRCL